MPKLPQPSQGFTLLELLLAIGISLLIAVGVFRTYQSIDRDTKIKQTASLSETLFRQANYITAQGSMDCVAPVSCPTDPNPLSTMSKCATYTVPQVGAAEATLSTSLFLTSIGGNTEAVSRLYPSGITVTDTEIYHSFDGNVQIQTESSVGSANDLVALRFEDIPSKACLSLLQRVAPLGLYDMWVSNSLVAMGPAPTTHAPGRNIVSVAKTRPLCNANSRVDITLRMIKPVDLTTMRRRDFGTALSDCEVKRIQPLYDRQRAAMDARENAQSGL